MYVLIITFNFHGDNARVFQRVSIRVNLNMGRSSRMRTIVSIYSQLLGLLNLPYRLRRVTLIKNLWLFMFEMHLISVITDKLPRPPCQAKCKNQAPT